MIVLQVYIGVGMEVLVCGDEAREGRREEEDCPHIFHVTSRLSLDGTLTHSLMFVLIVI